VPFGEEPGERGVVVDVLRDSSAVLAKRVVEKLPLSGELPALGVVPGPVDAAGLLAPLGRVLGAATL
jgi:hypothetical protein